MATPPIVGNISFSSQKDPIHKNRETWTTLPPTPGRAGVAVKRNPVVPRTQLIRFRTTRLGGLTAAQTLRDQVLAQIGTQLVIVDNHGENWSAFILDANADIAEAIVNDTATVEATYSLLVTESV